MSAALEALKAALQVTPEAEPFFNRCLMVDKNCTVRVDSEEFNSVTDIL
jgi:hypothetical protein